MSKPNDEKKASSPTPRVEGHDFYWENGLMVLTEAYLLRRGKCCGSGCRHCPYRKGKGTPSEPSV